MTNTHGDTSCHVTRNATVVLAGLACHTENKTLMMRFPGILDAFINIAENSQCDSTQLEAAKGLKGLAWDVNNKAQMVKHQRSIEALIKLTKDSNSTTKVHAVEALNYLAAAAETKASLTHYQKGAVLDALMAATQYTGEVQFCAGALGTLGNLVSRRTASEIASHPCLLPKLAKVAAACRDERVSTSAALVLKKLASHINANNQFHEGLLEALLSTSSGKGSGVLSLTSKAFMQQSMLAKNRLQMTKVTRVLAVIAKLSTCHVTCVKNPAIETLANMTQEKRKAKRIAATDEILETLVKVSASVEGSRNSEARRNAVVAILHLATHHMTRVRVAKQRGLVSSLFKYGCSEDNDIELKPAAVGGVNLLAPCL